MSDVAYTSLISSCRKSTQKPWTKIIVDLDRAYRSPLPSAKLNPLNEVDVTKGGRRALDVYVIMYFMDYIKSCSSIYTSEREEADLNSIAVMVDLCLCGPCILIGRYCSIQFTSRNDCTDINLASESGWSYCHIFPHVRNAKASKHCRTGRNCCRAAR